MMRLSGLLRRGRAVVFALWLVVLAGSVWVALDHRGELTGGGFEVAGTQSLRVQDTLAAQYPLEGASPLALVADPQPGASDADMAQAVDFLRRQAADVGGVAVVDDPRQPPPSGARPYVLTLRVGFTSEGSSALARQLRALIGIDGETAGRFADGRVSLHVIGQGALGVAASETTKRDIAEAETWNLPVILVVLLAVFGSLAAALMPLALGVCTVAVTMGVVYLLASVLTMSVFVTSTVSMFGIALAVDYSLFILMRFREELRAGRDGKQAVDAAMATSGLAVVLSGLTVIASVCGIFIIDTAVLRSMALGAILAVAFAVLTSVTLIPALLATFGRAAAKRSSLLQWSRRPEVTQSRFWTRWIGAVMRRPWWAALGATALLLVLAAPVASMTLGNSLQKQFDAGHEIRDGVDAAAQALGPGALGPIRVLVGFPDGGADGPANAPTLAAVRASMEQAPDVVSVTPPQYAADNGSALLSATLSIDPEDLRARESIDWMRERLPRLDLPTPATVDVGGSTSLLKDFDDEVAGTGPAVFLFVSLIAFVMLLVSIRSVFLAFKGVLMTVLSVAAAYGSLVVVFQWGWLEALGFTPLGQLDSTVPPLVLALTFGLSMDYEIFLLTRIRERFLLTGDTRDAVAYGVSTSARTITSAALIMIAVFTGFAFAGMPVVAQLGVACAVAIAVDATVVRLVLVPALMAMLDQWNWWIPRWLGRLLPSVDFEKPLPRAESGDVVVIPDDISGLVAPGSDLRMVVKNAAKLRVLAPDAISVADPLALSGCTPSPDGSAAGRGGGTATLTRTSRATTASPAQAGRPLHPVTVWRGRLAVALDALGAGVDTDPSALCRRSPVETTTVILPTGDRLAIPTGAEALRLKGYLVLSRNSSRDYAGLAAMTEAMDPRTSAAVLLGIDRYYRDAGSRETPIANELVRRLADPRPGDGGDDLAPGVGPDIAWPDVRRRCLAVAVAMLEEAG